MQNRSVISCSRSRQWKKQLYNGMCFEFRLEKMTPSEFMARKVKFGGESVFVSIIKDIR